MGALLAKVFSWFLKRLYNNIIQEDCDLVYTNNKQNQQNTLDVYYPKQSLESDVLVFIHGGAWRGGNKGTYRHIGHSFARKGLVTVIPNYNLSPNSIFNTVEECTAAIMWVYQNIATYGGNPNRIFVMGHSAGGHMIALLNSDPRYFRPYKVKNPIYGLILLDAFGLDMYEYLSTPSPEKYSNSRLIQVFSSDPQNWKLASPMRYWKNIRNPQLILIGERTHLTIELQNQRLYEELMSSQQVPVEFHEIPGSDHMQMVASKYFSQSRQYDIILNFIKKY
ncbi:hypothetical protein I4U23_027745 [Adineta vaga]|nr:hypothetical protein I4U23_027745 [Adineta vaga]